MNLKERLAERLQAGIPLTERPYRDIGDELNCGEEDVLAVARGLIEEKLVRSFGAFVDFERLGYTGILFGLAVPEARVGDVASLMMGRDEVTHAYLRDHAAGLWCTALLKGPEGVERFTREVLRACGCPFVLLETEKRLKLRPTFRFSGEESPGEETDTVPGCVVLEEDLAALALLQTGFPVLSRPFDGAAERLETTAVSLLERLKRLQGAGVLRRIGASLDHRRVGYDANALVAWDAENVWEAGDRATRFPWVSHCYLRRTLANTLPFDWTWPLFTMVHARTGAMLDARVAEMREALAPRGVAVMPTVRELKKTRYLLRNV